MAARRGGAQGAIKHSNDFALECLQAAVEADHVHNIPGLVSRFSIDLLDYHVNVEVPSYIAKSTEAQIQPYRGAWQLLNAFLAQERAVIARSER